MWCGAAGVRGAPGGSTGGAAVESSGRAWAPALAAGQGGEAIWSGFVPLGSCEVRVATTHDTTPHHTTLC